MMIFEAKRPKNQTRELSDSISIWNKVHSIFFNEKILKKSDLCYGWDYNIGVDRKVKMAPFGHLWSGFIDRSTKEYYIHIRKHYSDIKVTLMWLKYKH